MGALKKMKRFKAASMDSIIVEILKYEGISIIDWLLRIFNRCVKDWEVLGIVPMYKGKVTGENIQIIEE